MGHGLLLVDRGLGLVDLHLVALGGLGTLIVDNLILLQQFILTLALNIDAAVVGELVLLGYSLALTLGALDTLHLGVLVRGLLPVGLDGLGLLLFAKLFGAVLVLVGDKVGLRLLGRELGWGRSLGIPVEND